jgi:hypothetical protein
LCLGEAPKRGYFVDACVQQPVDAGGPQRILHPAARIQRLQFTARHGDGGIAGHPLADAGAAQGRDAGHFEQYPVAAGYRKFPDLRHACRWKSNELLAYKTI